MLEAIAAQAKTADFELDASTLQLLVRHAQAVLDNNQLHLTSITDPAEFVTRHLGETFVGAVQIAPGTEGVLLDMGTGNGYPGLALQLMRPSLHAWLAEASAKKAAFLQQVAGDRVKVLQHQIQRVDDLRQCAGDDAIRLLTTRAMGGWERVLPRLASAMTPDGQLLLWAGEEVEAVRKRKIWSRWTLQQRLPLPGRDQAWLWVFDVAS